MTYTTTDKQLVQNYKLLLSQWLKNYLPYANDVLASSLFEKTDVPVVSKPQYQICIEAGGSGVVIAPNLTFDIGETISNVKRRIIDTVSSYNKFTIAHLMLQKYEKNDKAVEMENMTDLENVCSDGITTLSLLINSDDHIHLEKIKDAFKRCGGKLDPLILLESAEKGYISCVHYIYTHIAPVYVNQSFYGDTLNAQMQSSACEAGQLNVLKCINLFSAPGEIIWTFHSYRVVIQHNKTDCLQYMFDSIHERNIYISAYWLCRLQSEVKHSNKNYLEYLSKIEKYYRENRII